jgi:hypothetical protein
MIYQGSFNTQKSPNPFNSILSLIVMVAVLVLLFFLVKGFFTLLYWVSPVMLIATLIINYRVVSDYILDIGKTFRRDVLWGVVKVLFTALCYPLVIGWLFVKALFYRRVATMQKEFNQKMNQSQEEQFIDYEELNDDKKSPDADKPTLFELPKPKTKEPRNPYDNLFDS